MNPLCKKVSMVECTGPHELPALRITFRTVEDMQAASDFIRWLTLALTPEQRERGFQRLLTDVMKEHANNG